MRGEAVDGALVRREAQGLRVVMARHHLVVPLLAALKRLPPGPVPSDLLHEVEHAAARTVARNLQRWGLLVEVLRTLQAAGVEAVVYKGPAIAFQAHGDLSARAFNDLDLLVRPCDAGRARQALRDQGYRERHALGGAAGEFLTARKRGCHLRRAGSAADIDLQWAFTQDYGVTRIDVAALFRTRVTLAGPGGGAIPTLRPDAHLLILCLHGAKHRWHRLDWVWDVAALVKRQDLPWESLFRESEVLGLRRILATGLLLADTLLAAPLPPAARQRAASDPMARRLCEEVRGELASGAPVRTEAWVVIRFYARSRERWADRLRVWWRWLVTPTRNDLSWMRLPAALVWAYYLARPCRLTLRLVRAAWWRAGAASRSGT